MSSDIDFVQKQFSKLSAKEQAREFLRCRTNPFYFIFNYVQIPETGGVMRYTSDKMHSKFKQTVRSVFRYHRGILLATRQLGKALAIDTPIPLPDGRWTTMEDLKVGDIVLNKNYSPTNVIGTTAIMYSHKCYEVKFDYSNKIIADENHLWKINNQSKEEIVTTKTLKNLIDNHQKINIDNRIYITSITEVESVPVKCIQVDASDGMFLAGEMIPTHNSSLAGCLLEWAGNFYPGLSANIINANKTYSQGNLSIIKYIHEGLPTGLKVPLKYKGERKTTIEYDHGSIIRTFYPSSNTSPDSLARSLTSPILYIDEAAHIRGMQQAYGAAYPTLSKAQEQAARNKYPYFVLITSQRTIGVLM